MTSQDHYYNHVHTQQVTNNGNGHPTGYYVMRLDITETVNSTRDSPVNSKTDNLNKGQKRALLRSFHNDCKIGIKKAPSGVGPV